MLMDFSFVNLPSIGDLKKAAQAEYENSFDDGYPSAKEALEYFAALRSSRPDMYLDEDDFEMVLRWKLRGQYGRQRHIRLYNTPELIKFITRQAFAIEFHDTDYETELKAGTLCLLKGVSVGVASAILTLCYPERYGVLDFRTWHWFDPKGERKRYFSISDYSYYTRALNLFANIHGMTPQQLDFALWAFEKP
jgi:hypothetical protein